MDKRIVRTRLAVFNAVFELAAEKELDKITVVELCERAGINKSTFYLHYTSKNDCLQKCFDLFIEKVLEFGKDIDYAEMSAHPEETISKMRGKWYDYGISAGKTIPLLPTFHPAYLLRNPAQKAKSWFDMLRLAKKISNN